MSESTEAQQEVDPELLRDFLEDFEEKRAILDEDLKKLRPEQNDDEVLADIFRAMHTIKGSSIFCQIAPVGSYTHAFEELLTVLRSHTLPYTDELGQLLMYALERLDDIVERFKTKEPQDAELNQKIEAGLLEVATNTGEAAQQAVTRTLSLINGQPPPSPDSERPASEPDTTAVTSTHNNPNFLQMMMERAEERHPQWQGRGARSLSLALEMNALLDSPIDPEALSTAIYLHDFSMALLPEAIINGSAPLSAEAQTKLQQHPLFMAEMAKRLGTDQSVWEMIMQHHEQPDGNGYPMGLKGEEICNGAQLINVVDAYIAITVPKGDPNHKRSVMQAIMMLNKDKGIRYSESWVDILTSFIKSQYVKNS